MSGVVIVDFVLDFNPLSARGSALLLVTGKVLHSFAFVVCTEELKVLEY